MRNFEYFSPIRISFGYGARGQLRDLAAAYGREGFLIADPAVANTRT